MVAERASTNLPVPDLDGSVATLSKTVKQVEHVKQLTAEENTITNTQHTEMLENGNTFNAIVSKFLAEQSLFNTRVLKQLDLLHIGFDVALNNKKQASNIQNKFGGSQ